MTNERLTLREVAQTVLTKHDVSGRQLDALARKRGLTISYTTINGMASGSYSSTPSDKTLDALVALSGLDQAVVYAAARRPVPLKPLAERLPADADSLTGEQQDAVLAVVRQFAKVNRALHQTREDVRQDAAATNQAGGNPAPEVQVQATERELDEARELGRRHAQDEVMAEVIGGGPPPRPVYEAPDLTTAYERGRASLTAGEVAEVRTAATAAAAPDVQQGPWAQPEEELPWASHPKKGHESTGRQVRRELDEVGEENQDPGEGP